MKIKYSPQISDNEVIYDINGDVISCLCNGEHDTFDFSQVPADSVIDVETSMPIRIITSAKRDVEGVLWLRLYKPISSNATENERFPEWTEV